jgi:5'-methylthioadenosine phosphorylase
MQAMKVGLITGSGSYSLAGFTDASNHLEQTRFGEVELIEGSFGGVAAAHISRHGEGHARLSSHVNHRANISALMQRGVQAVLAVTVCGAVDPALEPGSLVVFDDLHFIANRLPDGSPCSLYDEPGMPGRGHWVFNGPFSEPLRDALLEGARATGLVVRAGGCYGHVDGPRFNSRAEIRALRSAGVCAVSQTAGPETVLAGEAELPYALLGYVTDYANGAGAEPTPVAELMRLLHASRDVFAEALAVAVDRLGQAPPTPATGTVIRFD